MGQGALCNACRIRLRPAEALPEPVHVHLPPPATVISAESPADGWISEAWISNAYRLKVPSPSPRREKSPSPAPATAPEEKKQKRRRKPWHPRKSSKQCHHCKSASTPQWRMGPTGPSTLCNACGVRYSQGRLLQEYRPAASPNFEPSEHACKHREVLQLRQKKHRGKEQQHQPPEPGAGDGMEQHLPPPPAQAHAGGDELPMAEPMIPLDQLLLDAIDGSPETHIMYSVGGDLQMGDPSSLDQFLFEGPSAPLLIDDDADDDAD